MKSRDWLHSLVLLAMLTPEILSGTAGQGAHTGPFLVVERVESGSPAELAGLRPEDVLLSWSREGKTGDLRSPLELDWVEAEQSPRGRVMLNGLRGAEQRSWVLDSGTQGLQARPELPGAAFESYRQAQVLIAGGRRDAAALALRDLALSGEPADPWLGAWLFMRAADLFSETHNRVEADHAFLQALQQAQSAGWIALVEVSRHAAAALHQQSEETGALARLQPALEACEKNAPGSLVMAGILSEMAAAARAHAEFARADGYLAGALALQEKLAPRSLTLAKSYVAMGTASFNSNPERAAEYFHKAIAIQEELAPGSLDFADSLNNLGHIALARNDLAQAEQYYRRSLAIQEKQPQAGSASAWNWYGLGYIEAARGNPARGEEYYRNSLALLEAGSPESMDEATVLEVLANLALQRGDLKSSEQSYRHALNIAGRIAPSGYTAATALTGLGSIAFWRHDLPVALRYERQALALFNQLAPGSAHVAGTLRELGDFSRSSGDFSAARALYRRALHIYGKIDAGGAAMADVLTAAGETELQLGNLPMAETHLRRAWLIQKKLAPASLEVAETIHALGDLARIRGDRRGAFARYREALAIRREVAPGSRSHGESLMALAQLARGSNPAEAARMYEDALLAFEKQTSMLGGMERSRSAFRSSLAEHYRSYLDFLVERKQPRHALEILERSRAQTLLEMLISASVDLRQGVDANLLARERRLRQQLSDIAGEKLRRVHAGRPDEAGELLAQYEDVLAQIREASPAYAALTQPQPVNATAIQNELLDSGTLLLEYSLGARRSYLFAVTRSDFRVFALPGREAIERAANRFYRQASSMPVRPGHRAQAMQALDRQAMELSHIVLGPAAGLLANHRLLIVADGSLQFVPFAVLPNPVTTGAREPLMVRHEIVNLPSASVLSALRTQAAGRKPALRSVAVLADPVFDPLDLRLKQPRSAALLPPAADDAAGAELLLRSASDAGMVRTGKPYLPRLSFSRQEALAIGKLLPAGDGLVALDFQASRAMATSAELAQFRAVHFATHALLDSRHPEFSGLVFSLVNEKGEPQNGFLSLQDIYNLNLPVDLVTLSACETGLGKAVRAEGLIGLTRGFIHAGASRVLASLWKVDDAATAELMRRFYSAMEVDGLPPGAALRRAQISLWKEKRWSDPFFWGAFQLQGEYR